MRSSFSRMLEQIMPQLVIAIAIGVVAFIICFLYEYGEAKKKHARDPDGKAHPRSPGSLLLSGFIACGAGCAVGVFFLVVMLLESR